MSASVTVLAFCKPDICFTICFFVLNFKYFHLKLYPASSTGNLQLMKLVSIITVNFNQPQVTEDLLASITALNTYPGFEVIVVDNGSSQNYVPQWRIAWPAFRFIRAETNLGFAGGN